MRPRLPIAHLVLVLALAPAGCIHPPFRPGPPPEPGARVRVRIRHATPARYVGTVVSFTGDSVVLRPAAAEGVATDGAHLAFPMSAVRTLEVSRGIQPAWPEGLSAGMIVGLAIANIGWFEGGWWIGDATWYACWGGGAGAGALVGSAFRVERWRRVR